jgi:hypothetical protein
MRHVLIRDDDTNALTPPAWLERLYRPFLDRGLPVNIAAVPEVATDARTPDGATEGFLVGARRGTPGRVPIAEGRDLVDYLRRNPGFHVAQHGLCHETFEFDRHDPQEIVRRLERGARLLQDAGLPAPCAFVPPHDKLSRASFREVVRRYDVVSVGWFERGRMPVAAWPQYALARARHRPHWRHRRATLLSHPGCLLSRFRDVGSILGEIQRVVARQQVTVLVTHWWEYFPDGRPDEVFTGVLHELAAWLAAAPEVKVASFADVACGEVRAA